MEGKSSVVHSLQRSDPVGGVPCPVTLLDTQWHWEDAPEYVKLLSPSIGTNSRSYLFGCRIVRAPRRCLSRRFGRPCWQSDCRISSRASFPLWPTPNCLMPSSGCALPYASLFFKRTLRHRAGVRSRPHPRQRRRGFLPQTLHPFDASRAPARFSKRMFLPFYMCRWLLRVTRTPSEHWIPRCTLVSCD